MKSSLIIVAVVLCVAGCKSSEVIDEATPGRVARKEYKDMTQEEKIDFINKTPMPDEAKQKQIAAIKNGTDK